MKYIVALLTAIVCGLLSYTTLDKSIADRIKVFHIARTDEYESKVISKRKMLILSMLITIVSLAVALKLTTHIRDIINITKMLIVLVCLVGAGCNDYREHRIPNIFPMVLAISGIFLLSLGAITGQEGAMSYVITSAYATIGVACCMCVASLLSKGGVGIGDIKLLSALAIIGGVYTVCGTLFFSVILCALLAIALLVSKKKTLKSSLPFGPFMFMGYVISIFVSIY